MEVRRTCRPAPNIQAAETISDSRSEEAWLFAEALRGNPNPMLSRQLSDARAADELRRSNEVWLFAQAILGKPVPKFSAEVMDVKAEYERRMSKNTRLFAEALLGTGPPFSPEPLTDSAEEGLPQCLAATSTLYEGTWDPSKHPRGGFSQNRGWWSPAGGSGSAEKVAAGQKRASTDASRSPATKSQLPADDRGTWIKGTKGDGVFRYNNLPENQQAGIAGKEVRYEDQHIAVGGFPAEAYYRRSAAKAGVEIETFTGTNADSAAADAAMRTKLRDPAWQRPDGYKWNHAGPPGSKVMELVDGKFHTAMAHKG